MKPLSDFVPGLLVIQIPIQAVCIIHNKLDPKWQRLALYIILGFFSCIAFGKHVVQ